MMEKKRIVLIMRFLTILVCNKFTLKSKDAYPLLAIMAIKITVPDIILVSKPSDIPAMIE